MDDNLIIKEKFENSPQEIKDYISRKDWEKIIFDIVTKEGLNPEQKNSLTNEVLFILLGLDLPKNLPQNISSQLQIDSERAQSITNILLEKILTPFEMFLPAEETGEPETSQQESLTENNEWKKPELASLPNYSNYETGSDPYREPLE